jgi:hypothetical protein
MIFLEEGFSQEEYRAFCATGEGNGVKNDCSSSDGGGSAPRATSAWKSKQGPVFYPPKELAKKPPAKSLAKAGSVAIMDGELTADALKSIGVTLDQAVKACAAVTSDSHLTISHGSLKDIAAIDDSNPERIPSGVVTVLNDMTVNGMDNAVATAVSLSREQDSQSLVMAYTMLKVSSEAQKSAQFSIARQMMKGTVDSITQAEKIGVDRVEMLAAGSRSDQKFKGYRIWPRLGFDGVIPRKVITPTYTLTTGLFNSYGSKIPKEILSPRAKQEMKEGALTVQALYETDGGQKWWEQYGSEIVMTLDIGDSKSPGWNRFKSLQAKFSSRSIDMFEAFFDAESADVMDQAWAEIRAYCATGEGGGQKNDCPPSSVGTAAASDDWKSERKPISMTYDQLDKAPPVTGGDVLDSFSISDPQMTQEAMKNIGIPTMDDLVTLGGGVVRRGDVAVFAGGDDFVTVNLAIPVSTTEDYAGSVHTQTVITQFFDDEGRPQSHLAFEGLVPKDLDRSSDRDVARVTSIMMQRVVESMARADDLGFATASMEAVGDASRVMKGYRLWPQFGFDGEIPERTQREIPASVVEQVWRKHRPDLFATRVPASAILRGLRAKPITIQQLISITEGDRWWNENGSNITLSLDFNDKSSLGYKKFKEKKDRLPRLRERNKSRSMEEWIEDLIESRACDDADRQAGGRFGSGNDCASGGSSGESSEPASSKKPSVVWTPGTSLASVTQSAVAVPATVRSDDGKRIISTSLGSRDDGSIYEFPKGTEYVGTVEVGRHLVEQQAPERGAAINTGKKLDSTSRSYITSSLVHQVQTATDRGIRPAFYSPEERARQIEVYSEITPEIKGGRLKDGTSIDTENAEHLFRALQALTSPNASPFGNMQRTDSLLQKFFRGDGRVTTSTKFGVTGGSIISGLGRYQAIVDRLGRRTDGTVDVNAGLAKTRELFTNTVMKSGDFEEFFGDIFGGNDDDLTWKPGSYLVGQEVPLFCTFGPKVGTFFANNNGELDHLTADIWWTRTWGRISGELVKPASAESGKKHADKLVAEVGNASADQLHGVDGNELLKAANQMKSTGIVPDVVRIWASARLRHYAAGDYKEKKGVAGRLNKVAKNIVDNDVSLMGDPGNGTRRSNMIAVAREAARKAGQPVAYMQDILWQDEQDAYAAAGAKTVTSVGSLSLYSDTIARLVSDKENRLPVAKKVRGEKRSLEDGRQETEFDDYALGGREQMLYAYATAGISDEDFADRVIALAEKATKRSAKESRAFCPTGEGNGIKNSCSSSDEDAAAAPAPPQDEDEGPQLPAFGTEKDASYPKSTVDSIDGPIDMIDRSDISTPDYLDEVECHGAECGLGVTFDEAKSLQPDSDIDPDWAPLDAYIGKGYGYFTGNDSAGADSIDFLGIEYGTIDDSLASDIQREKLLEAESEWDAMSDEQKAHEAGEPIESWVSSTDEDKQSYKKAWLANAEYEISDEVDQIRESARESAVEQMKKELEREVAQETIECCLQLYRGIKIDQNEIDSIIKSGYVSHQGVNSWTTSRGVARSFGANRLLLVTRKPRVGHIFSVNRHEEMEVVRPPSRMKIIGVVKTKTGTVLYIDEDEDYKES